MDEKYWSDLVQKWITESQLTHKELEAAYARIAELMRHAEAAQQSSDEWYRQFAAAKAQLETAEAATNELSAETVLLERRISIFTVELESANKKEMLLYERLQEAEADATGAESEVTRLREAILGLVKNRKEIDCGVFTNEISAARASGFGSCADALRALLEKE